MIAEWVELGRDDERRGQSVEIVSPERRGQRVVTVLGLGEVVGPAPREILASEEERIERFVRDESRSMVERWIDEQLERERGASTLAREERDRGREVAAGARTADGETARVQAELRAVLCDPARGGVAVLEPCRERILGASRYATDTTAQGVPFASRRQTGSAAASEPSTQPPPKKYMRTGGGRSASGA